MAGKPTEAPRGQRRVIRRINMDQRREKVSELYLSGQSQQQIADELGVNKETVTLDLKALHKGWVERSDINFGQKKAEELAKIDHLEAEAWEAWHRSCRDCEIQRTRTESVRQMESRKAKDKVEEKPTPTKKVKGGHKMIPVRVSTEVTIKGQTGDARFLEQIAWCIETRLRVMGALKQEINNTNVLQVDYGSMVMRQPQQNTVDAVIEQVRNQARVTIEPGQPLLLGQRNQNQATRAQKEVVEVEAKVSEPEPKPKKYKSKMKLRR